MDTTKNITPLTSKVEMALITNLFELAKLGFIASILCGTIVFIYLINIRAQLSIYTWFCFFLLIILVRVLIVNKFFKQKNKLPHPILWRNLFIMGALFSGISWGFIGSPLFLPKDHYLQQALIMVILSGISAGAVPLLASSRSAALAFILPTLLPLIINLLLTDISSYYLFNIAIIIYLVYLIVLTNRAHHLIRHSYELQFENELLIQSLSLAKNQLEISNKKLEQAATHDPLTHIANRSLFELNFLEAIQSAAAENKILALLYLDLDHFKEANDIYGHNVGDEILLVVVSRIKNILRGNDIVSRLGGDELTIIIENVLEIQDVADIAERICHAIAQPIKVEQVEIHVQASIGISIYPIDGTDMDTLVRVADRAMYYVKDHGGNNYHFNVKLEFSTT